MKISNSEEGKKLRQLLNAVLRLHSNNPDRVQMMNDIKDSFSKEELEFYLKNLDDLLKTDNNEKTKSISSSISQQDNAEA